MNKSIYISVVLLFSSFIGHSQGIRKNYLEMTEDEKIDLVNAFYALRQGDDLVNDLATFHTEFFNFDNTATPEALDIHFNLPDEAERNIFLAWHRYQMYEMEQAMQLINPRITLPYWDAATDGSIEASLWDMDFMGQFDSDWDLGRNLGGFGTLPTVQELTSVQQETDFLLYSDALERGTTHAGPHRWVGGVMRTPASPRDPVFYLHHTNIDRLWNEWQALNNSSFFLRNSMLRYDGSYVFGGSTLPLINPNDIVTPNQFGVFYAKNGTSTLSHYQVSNIELNNEYFYYQFTIEAGDGFVIPAEKTATIESVTEVVLTDGFVSESGSDLSIKIDAKDAKNITLKESSTVVRNQIPFPDIPLDIYAYDDKIKSEPLIETTISVFPNPFVDDIVIYKNTSDIVLDEIQIFDITGRLLVKESLKVNSKRYTVNLQELDKGVYIIYILGINGQTLLNDKIVKY